MRRILVTGGAGYIGSHTCKQLAQSGVEPIVYDNLSRGHKHAVRWGPLVIGDLSDRSTLRATLEHYKPEGVIHFAALAYVGESIDHPAKYYLNNVVGTFDLLQVMRECHLHKIVFSSSCATYGTPSVLPICEEAMQAPISPYGRTKLIGEQLLADMASAYGLRFISLRYFNAAGADPDLEIGECHDPETHLIPRALMAAAGLIPLLHVMGDDYPTPDGTCIRDYVHVTDLAHAHVQAFELLSTPSCNISLNVGTGTGISIREILQLVQDVTGQTVPVAMRERRVGDPPAVWSDPTRARQILGFSPRFSDKRTIVETAWKYLMASSQRYRAVG